MNDHEMTGLSVQHLSKRYGIHVALKDISFQVPLQTVLAVIGPSGAGKTTLLRCIAALERPDVGEILFNSSTTRGSRDADPVPLASSKPGTIGMVFQGLNLWPHMTVLENVSYALTKTRAVDQQEAIDRAMQALESIGLAHKVSSYPDSLSGGEAQRVAIIRALVLKPSLLLLDEITSALDVERTWEVLDLVQRLAHEGITIVIVTHELGFARNVATQIAFMDNGCLIEHGATKDIFGSPKSQRTQQFFSHALT